ncbi:MAG TPA: septation protein A [Rhizomicrobium sp.]|nr:septation protein A [Rhizomicrobium sp.]
MNPQVRRLLLDLGPLAVFFAAFELSHHNIILATEIFIPTILASLGIGFWLERKLSPMAIVTALMVTVFGGLTIYFNDATFIKMKPTAFYLMFSGILLGGLAFNRLFIKYALSFEFEMPESAWRTLTWRWGLFFLGLAMLNEIVWRNFTTGQWVIFKVWITMPLVFLFGLAQAPTLMRHMPQDKPAE